MGPGGRDDRRLQERCLDRNMWDVQTDWMTGYGERRERPRMTPRCFTQMPRHVQKQGGWGKSVWCWGLHSSLGTCYAGKPVQQGRPSTKKTKQKPTHCSLEGMMLKLKLQYFGYHMRSIDSLEQTLMLGGIGGRRRRGRQRMRWLDGITVVSVH